MKNIIEKIHNSGKLTKAVAVVLATAVCVTSIWHGWGNKSMDVNAETAVPDSNKAYIEYIMDRMIGGLQENFTVLEIVPHISISEFVYYADDPRVKNGLESNQELLKVIYNSQAAGQRTDDEWNNISSAYGNFGYQIRYNTADNTYEVQSPNLFLNRVLPEYKDFFEGRIKVNAVEANKLTQEDIDNADFIIFANGNHDNSSYACYKEYSDPSVITSLDQGTPVDDNIYSGTVDKDGNGTGMAKVTSVGNITYNTFEMVSEGKYKSRDISWENALYLCDMLLNGKQVTLSDGSTATINIPVVIDSKNNGTAETGNAYKFMFMYRMLSKSQYAIFKNYLSTKDATGADYINSEGIVTAELSPTKSFPTVATADLKWSTQNVYDIAEIGNPYVDTSLRNEYKDYNAGTPNLLTNDFWIFPGTAALIPVNRDDVVATPDDQWGNIRGFTNRVGNDATAIDVLRYLLGAKDVPVVQLRNYDKLRILEIQPCVDFDYDTCDAVRALGQTLFLDIDGTITTTDAAGNEVALYEKITEANFNDPDANTCIQVDCMTSSAFNGINTDIVAEYDIVILGTNDSILLKDGEGGKTGNTIYNDSALNGYVYLAYGDLIKVKSGLSMYYPEDFTKYSQTQMEALESNSTAAYHLEENAVANDRTANNGTEYRKIYEFNAATSKLWSPYLAGQFENDSYYLLTKVESLLGSLNNDNLFDNNTGNARLSGNDISELKYNQLKEFVDAGKLVVLDENMYNYNESIFFPTSNMAAIAKHMKESTTVNKLQQESINSSLLLHLRNQNPVLSFSDLPTEVGYDADGKVNTENANGTSLPFRFIISGKANTDYYVNVYADKNNDGVFYRDAVDNDLNESYYGETHTLNQYGNIELGFNVPLADNFNGLINYKIEVIEVNDTSHRAAKVGYTYVKTDELKPVKVLQITPVRTNNNVVINGDDYDTLDMSGQSTHDGGAGTKFQQLLSATKSLIGYEIDVETVTTYEYESWFEGGNRYDKANPDENYWLDVYDMVVIGFGDLYGGDDITNENGALDCIMHFVDSGRAVLFTHDTVSYSPEPNAYFEHDGTVALYTYHNKVNSWGKELSAMFRARVGMDRYGITTSEFDETYDGEHEIYGLQGLNDMLLYRHSIADPGYNYAKYSSVKLSNSLSLLYPYNTSVEPGGDAASYGTLRGTTKVEKLNDGQVTMFPYRIDGEITVANTHAQWFQLDMEDEEIVVWYTLSDDGSESSQYYADTDRDAANNYYIYSKKNITYSGAGHSDMNNNNDTELKLFVNTIVKAITAGNNVPEVKVLESSFADGYYNVYVTPYSGSYTFTFYGRDLDLRPNHGRFQTAKLVLDNVTPISDLNDDGVIDDKDKPYIDWGNTLTSETRNTITITQGGDGPFDAYYDQITALIDSAEGAQFSIELTDMYGAKGEANVKLVKRQMFDLD